MPSGPRTAGRAAALLSLEAARLRVLAAASPLREAETLPVGRAGGRILAGPTPVTVDLPAFDNAAMDGYALHASDLEGDAKGGDLVVEGRTLAGDPPGPPLRPGTARRIMTGAPVPPGTAAVVMQERVQRDGDRLRLSATVPPGANVRRRGEDRAAGAEALPPGRLLTPGALALLAGCGHATVSVRRRVRVTLFSTGSERAEPGEPLGTRRLVDTSRVLLRAYLGEPWVELDDAGLLPDDPAAIRQAVRDAAARADVIVTSGCVSAGEADHVLDTLRRDGAELHVLKVAIRPGKPLATGRVGGALWVGLPANPFAAAVTFTQVARPALWRSAGLDPAPDLWIPAVAGFEHARTTGRTEFVPVAWDERDPLGRPVLRRLGPASSARLGPLALAQGLALIPAALAQVRLGQPLVVEPLP